MPSFSYSKTKQEILKLLQTEDIHLVKEKLLNFPLNQAINHLIGALCHLNECIKWKSIAGIGVILSEIAKENMERARIIIRRFMWMLNEESGGMAWGVPEAIAESLANSRILAEEYSSILISYIWKEGNYLDYPPAQRGVIWGIGRLSQVFPDLVKKYKGPEYALHLSQSPDSYVRAFWIWAYMQMDMKLLNGLLFSVKECLKNMPISELEFYLYDGRDLYLTSYQEILEKAFLKFKIRI